MLRRPFHHRTQIAIAVLLAGWLMTAMTAQIAGAQSAESEPTPATDTDTTAATNELSTLIEQLGDDDYRQREAATSALLGRGAAIRADLQAALAQSEDPEILRRLHYVIEHVTPPRSGLIVLNIPADEMLTAGDIITHINDRRIPDDGDLSLIANPDEQDLTVQLWTPAGPETTRLKYLANLRAAVIYEPKTGAILAEIIRDFANGYPERARQKLLNTPMLNWSQQPSDRFRALLDYTVGIHNPSIERWADTPQEAAALVSPTRQFNIFTTSTIWDRPAPIDLSIPHKAPFQLEWDLWNLAGKRMIVNPQDPDLRVQRVLVPAHRHIDALVRCAGIWWSQYRSNLPNETSNRTQAGNMLAVVSWMAYELDLLSECSQLIEPRSRYLRVSSRDINKWLRVHTDAWLPYLQGDPQAALDMFYEDALRILEHPLQPNDPAVLTQNPAVAGRLAFFLYQFPGDERLRPTLETVNHPHQSARVDYVWWMCHALRAGNFDVIREHLAALAPNLPGKIVPRYARGMALLEYIADNPTPAAFANASELIAQHAEPDSRAALLAEVQTLNHLTAGEIDRAAETVQQAASTPGGAVLRETVTFRQWLATAPLNTLSDRAPLIAVPADPNRDTWIVMTSARQLMRYTRSTDQLIPITDNSADWFPGVLNWPWLGFELESGRVWAYARNSLHEINAASEAVQASLPPNQIAEFDRAVRPVFSKFAQALSAGRPLNPRDGQYLATDVKIPAAPISLPTRPDVSELISLPGDARIVHLATRNGVHLLINTVRQRAWHQQDLGQAIDVEGFRWIMPVAARESESPLAYLLTDHGLMELDMETGQIRRRELPDLAADTPVVAEHLPYTRREPRYLYFAAAPEAGSAMYRLDRESDTIEKLETQHFGQRRSFTRQRSRSWIRAEIDRRLAEEGIPSLIDFIQTTEQTTKLFDQE
jgi:hypothetical protein